jgi:hypothetical protein
MEKPAVVSGAGIYDIGDDANVPLICPPRQVAKANAVQHCAIEAKSLGRGWRTSGRIRQRALTRSLGGWQILLMKPLCR